MAEKKEVLLVGLEYPNTMLSVTNLGDWDDEELKATQATSLLSRIRGRRQAIQSGSSVFPLLSLSLVLSSSAKTQRANQSTSNVSIAFGARRRRYCSRFVH